MIKPRLVAPRAPHINPGLTPGETYELTSASPAYADFVGRVFVYSMVKGNPYIIWLACKEGDGGYDALSCATYHCFQYKPATLQLV